MTKTKKQFVKYLEGLVKKYRKILRLDLSDITIEEDPKIEYISIGVNYPYKNSIIYFNDKSFGDYKTGKVKDFTSYIIHELCHIYTEPLYIKALHRFTGREEMENERERLTESICQLIRRCLQN